MRSFHGRRGLLGGVLTIAVAGSMILTLAAGSVSTATGAASKPHVTKVKGGTAYFAEPPGAQPNYIFPFAPFRYFSVNNLSQFQELMYRPLFWFGNGANPTINLSLSLANYPVFSNGGKTVTVTLKPYVWSDGEKVTSQDVVFWMNFMKLEKDTWAGYVPGTIPDDVASITTPNASTVVFNLTGSVNQYWWVYNELSQITPLPMAWDVTSLSQKAGAALCGTSSFGSVVAKQTKNGILPGNAAAKSCVDVFNFLSKEAGYDGQPEGLEQRLRHLCDEQALAGRRRTVAPDFVQRRGRRDDEAEPEVLGPGEADAVGLRRAALHLDDDGVQRAVKRDDDLGRLHPGRGHPRSRQEPDSGRAEQPAHLR